MKHFGKIIIISFAVCFLVFPVMARIASAQTTSTIVNVEFPCPSGLGLGNCQPSTDIPSYLNNLYKFAVGIAGALAVAMIVAGGVYYTISAGSSDKQREAKSMITSAIWGIILLFGSYLILRTVNPQITNLNLDFTGKPVLTTTSSLEGESVQNNNNCSNFSTMIAYASRSQGLSLTCASRKAISTEAISIGQDSYYDTRTVTIPSGATVWLYPYFRGDQGPSSARCLIFAYRKVNSDTLSYITLDDSLKLCAPQAQTAAVASSSYDNLPPNTLSNDDAVAALAGWNVSVVSSGNCSDPSNPSCTSLQGIPRWVVYDDLKYLADNCHDASGNKCVIIVTGGTEVGHQTHGPGLPVVDLHYSPALGEFLKHNFYTNIEQLCTTAADAQYRINCNTDETAEHLHVKFKQTTG